MSENRTENISYYDEIAGRYDAIMDEERSNAVVREMVGSRFRKAVPKGRVLDFGGGTGADLGWLTEKGYEVVFCEPSTGMREKAFDRFRDQALSGSIDFLSGEAADFGTWHAQLPFTAPVDGILANFAVLNSIPDIGSLFGNLALVLRPGGTLIALVLRPTWRQTLRFLLRRGPGTYVMHFNKHRHQVFVHTSESLRSASSAYFSFAGWESFTGSSFCLIQLTRK